MVSIQDFNNSFSKFGFEIQISDEKRIVGFSMGTEFGIYLEIGHDNEFSIECVLNPFSTNIFYWQKFDSLAEIESLILKNHILSEQICENHGLA